MPPDAHKLVEICEKRLGVKERKRGRPKEARKCSYCSVQSKAEADI
jgi:hypothetical protein